MPRPSLTARVAALAAVCAAGAPVAVATASRTADVQATVTLAGAFAAVATGSPGVAAVSGTESETIEVWMAGHEQAAQRFVDNFRLFAQGKPLEYVVDKRAGY